MSALVKLLLSFLVFIPVVWAESTTPTPMPSANLTFEEAFSLGTKSYQDKKYSDAIAHFQKALDLHPESPNVLTNLGLSYFQEGRRGVAIGMLRRALYVDPTNDTAQAALKYSLAQLEVKEIPHQIETYERLRSNILNTVSLRAFHILLALLLFACGIIWLRYFGQKKKTLAQEEAPPAIPIIGIVLAIVLILSFSFTLLKVYDLQIPRATVIADKVSAQIAPGEGQTTLFDLYGGFEVVIKSISGDWVQVNYPGGLTGWVKKDHLMPISNKNAF